MNQVELMTDRGIIPFRVFELGVDPQELMIRGTKDRMNPQKPYIAHDSPQIQSVRISAYDKEIDKVRKWYQEEHNNFFPIDGNNSKWWIWNQTCDITTKQVEHIQTYLHNIRQGKAASIADMCIRPGDFQSRLGEFEEYCPVRLQLYGELVFNGDENKNCNLSYAAEYLGKYYKMAGPKELATFLEDPLPFVPPKAEKVLPSFNRRPCRRTPEDARSMFPMQLEFQGYCPVTFLRGKCRYEAIQEGNKELLVEYTERLYCFVDEECLDAFMR